MGTLWRAACCAGGCRRFVDDSPLEGDGFELSVPRRAIRPFGRGEDVFQCSGVRPIGLARPGFRTSGP
jgi:hypothetical protein